MSGKARVRLTVAETPETAPAGTRVLIRQRVLLFAVLGALTALACVPAFRLRMEAQARFAWLRKTPAWASLTQPGTGDARVSAELARRGPDSPLEEGAVIAGAVPAPERPGVSPDPRVEHFVRLHRRRPGEPALAAHALRYLTLAEIRLPSPHNSTRTAPRRVALALELAAAGAAAEPGNGFFPTMAAVAHLAADDRPAAVAAWRRAAACPTWRDHAFREGYAARDLLIAAWGDHGVWMHVGPVAAILLPHLAQVRQAARTLVTDPADLPLRAATARVGGAMARTGDTLICRLVGAAVINTAAGDASGRPGEHPARAATLARLRAFATRVRRDLPSDSEEVEAAVTAWQGLQDRPWAAAETWDRLGREGLRRDLIGFGILHNAGLALLLWLGAALLAAGLARLPAGGGAFWRTAPRPARLAAGAALGLPAVLAAALFATGAPGAGGAVLALTLTLAALSTGRPVIWTDRHGLLVALIAVPLAFLSASLLVGLAPAARDLPGAQLGLLGDPSAVLPWLLPAAVLPVAAALLALARRATPAGWIEATRAGARVLCLCLGVAYVGYLLWVVPTEPALARAADRAVAAEIAPPP